MKRIKEWARQHLVFAWASASTVFAVVIHICFSIPAPFDWLEATWSAGDVLTYASTVALGLLAIWQNQKFKEENDISQDRLERINIDSNELLIITKIIESETQQLDTLEKIWYEFDDSCRSNTIAEFRSMLDSSMECGDSLINGKSRITNATRAILLQLSTAVIVGFDLNSLKSALLNYSSLAMDSLGFMYQQRLFPYADAKKLGVAELEANRIMRNYLHYRRSKLHSIIFEKKSLAEIRMLYTQSKENSNEQTET